MRKSRILTAAVAGALIGAPAVSAPASEDSELLEIVVTARKREESLQQAPVAISVITAKEISSAGVDRITEVAARLPNFSSVDQPAGTGVFGFNPYIRGINSGGRNIGFDSGFGIFVNGAYAGRNDAANKFLPDIERVEFLPGPQATLFGKNTTLGVMNLVTRKPGDSLEGAIDASVGNYGNQAYGARISGPLSDSLGVTVTVGKHDYDGYYDNVIPAALQVFDPEGRYNGLVGPTFESLGGSIELVADISGTTVDLLLDYTDARRGNDVYLARVGGFDRLPTDVRESATMGNHHQYDWGGVLSIARDIGSGNLALLTAHRDFNSNIPFDGDGYAWPVQEGPVWRTAQQLTSQEIRYSGSVGPVSYLVGGYWQTQTSESTRVASLLGLADITVMGRIEATTLAAFANLDYQINDRWTVGIGLRPEEERKKLRDFTQSGGTGLGLIDIDEGPMERDASHVSYTGMVAFAVNDRINTHFRYSKGYKSGGYNIDFVTSPILTPLEFDDENADNYELGAKMRLTDRLFVNAVYFLTDYHDLQQSEYTRVSGYPLPVITTKNSGQARTNGVEVTASYRADRLTMNASLGTADARYTEWLRETADGFSDEKGKKFPAPDLTFNFFGEYRIPIGQQELFLVGEYLYRSRAPQAVTMPSGSIIPSDPASPERPSYHTDAIDTVNLRARLELSNAWSVSVWVRNLLDDRAVTFRQPNDAEGFYEIAGIFPPEDIRLQVTGDYQTPRHYGIDISYRFGAK